MRTATAAVVTIAVTFAIGGMIAFCRADGPAAKAVAAADGASGPLVDAEGDAVSKKPPRPREEAVAEHRSATPVPVRRWGDPEPAALPPESPVVAELAEIRARVGSAVPQDWEAFGVAAAGDEAGFERTVEALEAKDVGAGMSPGEGGAAVPPTLADSQFGGGQGVPFKPSPFQPFPDEWETGPPPGLFLPPTADVLPFESPEALGELTKLLSAAARDLERMAHVREEQRRYEDADRLRRLALQLRRENRRLLPEPTPNPAYAGPAVGRR